MGKADPKSPHNDAALEHSLKALSYAPTFPRIYYEIGQTYLNKKDYLQAAAAFQSSIDLNDTVGVSYWYLAAVKMAQGDTTTGLKLIDIALAKGYQLSENDYLLLGNIYIQRNDIAHIITIYEGLVKVAPTNARYHASLAVAYSKVNRIDEAVAEARVAAEVDPSFLPDAKAFVESLGRTW